MGNLATICARGSSDRLSDITPRNQQKEIEVDLVRAEAWEPSLSHPTLRDARMDLKRRFHAVVDSPYVLPADLCEQDRLSLQHTLLVYGFGKPFHMPIEEKLQAGGAKVLDCGCGPGAWTRHVAKAYPKSEVVGLDMAKTLFSDIEVLPNVTFVVGNVLERLPFPDNTFDAVYQRLLIIGIPKNKWVDVVKELMRVTKPGGYIELVEGICWGESPGPNYAKLMQTMRDSVQARGIDVDAGLNIGEYIKMAGMTLIEENIHSAPFDWGGQFGKYQQINGLAFWSGMRPFLCKVMNITEDEYDVMLETSQNECHIYKTYLNYYSAVGKVPAKSLM